VTGYLGTETSTILMDAYLKRMDPATQLPRHLGSWNVSKVTLRSTVSDRAAPDQLKACQI
jgi:hypothetical protein